MVALRGRSWLSMEFGSNGKRDQRIYIYAWAYTYTHTYTYISTHTHTPTPSHTNTPTPPPTPTPAHLHTYTPRPLQTSFPQNRYNDPIHTYVASSTYTSTTNPPHHHHHHHQTLPFAPYTLFSYTHPHPQPSHALSPSLSRSGRDRQTDCLTDRPTETASERTGQGVRACVSCHRLPSYLTNRESDFTRTDPTPTNTKLSKGRAERASEPASKRRGLYWSSAVEEVMIYSR